MTGLTLTQKGCRVDIRAYDACIERGRSYFNDEQLRRIADFRHYKGDRMRLCRFRKIDDPAARP